MKEPLQSKENLEEIDSFNLTKQDYKAAQTNLMLCVGIAMGIEYAQEEGFDSSKSFLEHAIRLNRHTTEPQLKGLIRSLQDILNEHW